MWKICIGYFLLTQDYIFLSQYVRSCSVRMFTLIVRESVPFLDPEDVKISGNVVLRRKPQSTFCVNLRPWLHSDIHIWVPSFWTLRILEN